MITSSQMLMSCFSSVREIAQIHSAALATTQNLRRPADNIKLQRSMG
jgi:hypothetical protein